MHWSSAAPHPRFPACSPHCPRGLGLSGAEVWLLWWMSRAEPAPHGGACRSLTPSAACSSVRVLRVAVVAFGSVTVFLAAVS